MRKPTLTTVDIEEPTPSADTVIDTADAKLDALKDLLWLLVERSGMDAGPWASVMYSIEDAQADLNRARDLMREEGRP
jgi:hypothetical protein